ncbi:CRAL/TRIO domain-containing protein [Patellaria atrata CBS 101060]|uniref:CRAL/TRIO domain-containing protein n=1 Tax=Patellaria atrata CBS 101060 TaxID=1346257 RepID=A0A9P4VNK1_9PEZI|nr:CRAL/TRIO domain-containing protein [Patellaria atrata CBS 101060]
MSFGAYTTSRFTVLNLRTAYTFPTKTRTFRARKPQLSSNSYRPLGSYNQKAASRCHTYPGGHTLESGFGKYTFAFVLTIVAGTAYFFAPSRDSGTETLKKSTTPTGYTPTTLTSDPEFLILLGMPSEIAAGRPGNLTAEQEAKLRQFWQETLKVFGIDELAPPTDGTATPQSGRTNTTEATDKKKSRRHLFNRKKKEELDSTDPEKSVAAAVNDKHGQSKEFQAALANLKPEDIRNAFWSMVKMDHPDALLLRFLRARKWDVQNALIMMISTLSWRMTEMHVDDDIMIKGEQGAFEASKSSDPAVKREGDDFIAQLKMGKSFLHGQDKDGRPLCFVRTRLHRQGEQTEASLERFTVYTIETARLLLRAPVDTATIVFDMTNFSMANMDYTPVKFMIKCFEANYPESLGAVLVYKAPWVFQGIWSIIRGWLDPVVASKIHFAKTIDELSAFIPRTQIPRELGGDEAWDYVYPAPPDPATAENPKLSDAATRGKIEVERGELAKRYEEVVLEWVAGEKEGKEVEGERNGVAEELRKNYWKLDPYMRARSLYDRSGVLGEGGVVNFYPEKKQAPETMTSSDDVD